MSSLIDEMSSLVDETGSSLDRTSAHMEEIGSLLKKTSSLLNNELSSYGRAQQSISATSSPSVIPAEAVAVENGSSEEEAVPADHAVLPLTHENLELVAGTSSDRAEAGSNHSWSDTATLVNSEGGGSQDSSGSSSSVPSHLARVEAAIELLSSRSEEVEGWEKDLEVASYFTEAASCTCDVAVKVSKAASDAHLFACNNYWDTEGVFDAAIAVAPEGSPSAVAKQVRSDYLLLHDVFKSAWLAESRAKYASHLAFAAMWQSEEVMFKWSGATSATEAAIDQFRDAEEAVSVAENAVDSEGVLDREALDVALGRFEAAVHTASEAYEVASVKHSQMVALMSAKQEKSRDPPPLPVPDDDDRLDNYCPLGWPSGETCLLCYEAHGIRPNGELLDRSGESDYSSGPSSGPSPVLSSGSSPDPPIDSSSGPSTGTSSRSSTGALASCSRGSDEDGNADHDADKGDNKAQDADSESYSDSDSEGEESSEDDEDEENSEGDEYDEDDEESEDDDDEDGGAPLSSPDESHGSPAPDSDAGDGHDDSDGGTDSGSDDDEDGGAPLPPEQEDLHSSTSDSSSVGDEDEDCDDIVDIARRQMMLNAFLVRVEEDDEFQRLRCALNARFSELVADEVEDFRIMLYAIYEAR